MLSYPSVTERNTAISSLQIQQAATVLSFPETEMARQPEVQTRPPEVAMAPMGS